MIVGKAIPLPLGELSLDWAASYLLSLRPHDALLSDAVRPSDFPRGHAPGPDPDRVLLIGAGPATGWGVTTHQLSLCGALARAVAAITQRGNDVDLVASPRMDGALVMDTALQHDLSVYDAVVVALGVSEALKHTSDRAWHERVAGLIAVLEGAISPECQIHIVGIQPARPFAFPSARESIADRRAARLNQVTAKACSGSSRVHFVPLLPGIYDAPDAGDSTASMRYSEWARQIAPSLATYLVRTSAVERIVPLAPALENEARRQRAIDALDIRRLDADATLNMIVDNARQAFGADSAMLTVLSGDRQVAAVRAGGALPDVDRAASFCQYTIQERGPLVVTDASTDPKFRENPLVAGQPHLRFYAGSPVSLPTFERIGALCVLDSKPRSTDEIVASRYLRELAFLAEKRIHQIVRGADAKVP